MSNRAERVRFCSFFAKCVILSVCRQTHFAASPRAGEAGRKREAKGGVFGCTRYS